MFTEENSITVFFVAGTLFVFLLIIFLFAYVYLHQQRVNKFRLQLHEQEIKKQNELLMALNEGIEKERKRLAEELHDGIGAKLSGLKMSMEYLKSNPETDKKLIEKVALGMNETIEELREISKNLIPNLLVTKGLEIALSELIEHYNNKLTCQYQLYVDVENEDMNQIQMIYRIVTELLNNIHKHSKATLASVQVVTQDNDIQIIIEDNGIGYDTYIVHQGIGLTNIQNRVNLCQGKLNIDSSPNGTVTIIQIPLNIS